MGIVFKARDRETGEVVALKVLRTELAKGEACMERFKDELRLARKVTHRNVCRIHEFVRTEDCAYISMEFVDGESLRQILNRFGALKFLLNRLADDLFTDDRVYRSKRNFRRNRFQRRFSLCIVGILTLYSQGRFALAYFECQCV